MVLESLEPLTTDPTTTKKILRECKVGSPKQADFKLYCEVLIKT